VRARFERLVGDGAFLGTATAYLTLLGYTFTARWLPSWVVVPERILLEVMGSGLGLFFEPIDLLIVRRGYLWLPIVAVVLAWRRTRPVAAVLLSAAVLIESARLAALGCFSLYVMDHAFGLLAAPLAVIPAALLTRWRRWSILSSVVLAFGLCLGVGLGVVFQHDFPDIVSPLNRFVPIALATILIALLVSIRVPAVSSTSVGRLVRIWGLLGFSVSCTLIIVVASDWLRPRDPSPHRFLPYSSYDVFITGASHDLVWTDTEDIHVLTNPYGDGHERYVLAGGNHRTPQRIWPSPTDGFYVQMLLSVGWWQEPPKGQRISQDPAVQYRNDLMRDGSPCAFVEDPVTRSVFMVNQWGSRYFVMDRDSGATRETGYFSTAFMGAWHATADLPSRVAYVSSALEDGGVYELNLDAMTIARRASALDLYETVFDQKMQVLWGARPVTGEVIGVGGGAFDVLYRFRTGFGSRDLQRDPNTGDLYTCSLVGEVFRVDVASGTAAPVAWCGRLCRNLFLDPQRDTLWVATDDGVCRVPLAALKTRESG
jgi:hypothetical protein